jgi:hypothetical protein
MRKILLLKLMKLIIGVLGDKTSNKEYSQNKDKEASGAHNDDVDG